MTNPYFEPDHQYVLNYCMKYITRYNTDHRHSFAEETKDALSGTICEAWRFPIVDSYCGGAESVQRASDFSLYNQVTFVFYDALGTRKSVSVLGTFYTLYQPINLTPIVFAGDPTPYWAVSVAVPKREVHRYRFLVDDENVNDPINPQTMTLPNGRTWSRFFTEACTENLVLEDWEQIILHRLAGQIAPLRTEDGERFLDQFYAGIDNAKEKAAYAYRFDESVGEVSFIDNILGREEHHRIVDYKICLTLLNQVLRQRDALHEPGDMPDSIYVALYAEMAADQVHGWDTTRYSSPLFFLNILRRHIATGVFSHPKYGGNAAGAGWAYLEDRYRAVDGSSLFQWRDALEPPLGTNSDYFG